MKNVTIIIPCFNEQESIPQLFTKLKELDRELSGKYFHSFLFVDDGSRDKTFDLLSARLSEIPGSRLVRHEMNKNLGAAIKTGVREAGVCDYLAFLDSDCTYDPAIILTMLKAMDEGADLSTVSPYHPLGKVAGVPPWRLFLSQGLSFLYRLILGVKLYTFTAMVRIIRQEKMKDIISERDDFSFMAVSLIKAIRKNYTIVEIPATLSVRQFGVSKMNLLRTIKSHLIILRDLLSGEPR